MEDKSILITVSGLDQPGITASLMEIIVKFQYQILDMGQSIIHDHLSLSMLIDHHEYTTPNNLETIPIINELLCASKKMGMSLDFKIVTTSSMQRKRGDRFILSCVHEDAIQPIFLKTISAILSNFGVNIIHINNIEAGHNFKSLEITTLMASNANLSQIKTELLQTAHNHRTDMALLSETVYRRSKRLIIFDMDSTLIQVEVIDEMAKAHGVYNDVYLITNQAMEDEIDFTESLLHRVSMLKGLDIAKMQKILDDLPLTLGAEQFVDTVKSLGYKLALISGGFDFFSEPLKKTLALDYAFANKLEVKDNKLTGKLLGTIVDAEYKVTLMKEIAKKEYIHIEQVVAIGDGSNDLPMLTHAGLGISFHAKEIVKKRTKNHLNFGPMNNILYFLGIPDYREKK